MTHIIKVPTFIIAILIAVAQLSETVYTPSLPDMAKDLCVPVSYVEYTLTVYLLGFAIGVFVWGTFSDYFGRKKGILYGLCIYTLSSIGCWLSSDITYLYIFRFIQAFGVSVGSVLGQAIARDAILPEERGRVYSIISMAMAFAPAIGPFIGAIAVENFHWNSVFLILTIFGMLILGIVQFKLPETNLFLREQKFSLSIYKACLQEMIVNRRFWGFSLLIGFINGIIFGYFAESPFYFVELLGISKTSFGCMAIYICIPLFIGGWISKKLNTDRVLKDSIIFYGITLINISAALYVFLVYSEIISIENKIISASMALGCISFIMAGNAMIIPNCFSQALDPFGKFSGTSSSLFGFTYYIFIALLTGVMGLMHDGTLRAMPLFMTGSGISMFLIYKLFIKEKQLVNFEEKHC